MGGGRNPWKSFSISHNRTENRIFLTALMYGLVVCGDASMRRPCRSDA